MPTATIEVELLGGPKPGKKMGYIKATDGQFYSVEPDRLNLFSEGGTYTINYTTRDFNGQTYRNFKSMVETPKANGSVPAKGGHTQAVEMAAMGFVGRWLEGAGNSGMDFPDVNRLAEMVSAAKNAWEIAFALRKPSGLDDEIPF